MSHPVRASTIGAWALFAICVVGMFAPGMGGGGGFYASISTGLGAVILTRQPGNRAGMLLLLPVVMTISAVVPLTDSDERWAVWIAVWGYLPVWILLPFLLPNGRLTNQRWRPMFYVSVGWCVLCILLLGAYLIADMPGSGALVVVTVIALGGVIICGSAGLVSLAVRFRRSAGRERAQLLWTLVAALLFCGAAGLVQIGSLMAGIGSGPASGSEGPEWLGTVGVVSVIAFPFALGIPMLRLGMFSLSLPLQRFLQVCLLFIVVSAAMGLAHLNLQSRPIAETLTTVAVALSTPVLYRWLQGGVSRLIYGRRGSPVQVLAELTRRLAQASGPDEVLKALTDSAHFAFEIAGTEIVLVSGDRQLFRIQRGVTDTEPTTIAPLQFGDSDLGLFRLWSTRPLNPTDLKFLRDMCDAAAAAVAAAHRAVELQAIRERLVIAREQERRRIGRDIHDGLGPMLSGLGFTVDALRERLAGLPDAADSASRVRAQIRDAAQLVRRVARELRPTAVDQLGLLQALNELASQHGTATLKVELEADIGDVELNPATEVATYMITAEALTNVGRHAKATRCDIAVSLGDGFLLIVVDDDGIGCDGRSTGVGQASMQERAMELGGRFCIGNSSLGGCRIEVTIPVSSTRTFID